MCLCSSNILQQGFFLMCSTGHPLRTRTLKYKRSFSSLHVTIATLKNKIKKQRKPINPKLRPTSHVAIQKCSLPCASSAGTWRKKQKQKEKKTNNRCSRKRWNPLRTKENADMWRDNSFRHFIEKVKIHFFPLSFVHSFTHSLIYSIFFTFSSSNLPGNSAQMGPNKDENKCNRWS